MKKILLVMGYGLCIMGLMGCASFMRPTPKVEKIAGVTPLPAYSGPKARLALTDFQTGSDLHKMLLSELVNSNRFLVVERQTKDTGMPQAELIITATVNEFEPESPGGKAGVGGGGGSRSGFLGGLLGPALNKARMSLDVRIVDASTSKILAANKIQGQSSHMEKAMRICVLETVRYISQNVPANYYKY